MPRKVAGGLSINCEIENYEHIKRKLDDLQKAPPKAMKAMIEITDNAPMTLRRCVIFLYFSMRRNMPI